MRQTGEFGSMSSTATGSRQIGLAVSSWSHRGHSIAGMSVSYALDDHVATITFDDGKANAYSHDVLVELASALDRAEADPEARSVLIAGRPGRFSAGFDLQEMTASDESMRTLVAAGGRFMARLLLEPLPVVAACTGHALAAGALVLLAADHRVGIAGDWKVGLNEVAIGMRLPIWAVELARYRMPPSAFDHIILGEIGGPDEARAAGFLDRVVAPEEIMAEAMSDAVKLAGLRRGAVEGTKRHARRQTALRMLDGIEEDLASLTGPQTTG
jgi:enoyl-CoA hydratase